MAEPVRVCTPTDQERQKLQQIVRRGSTSSVRYRRAMTLLASAGRREPRAGSRLLVAADEDTMRDVIHRFNEIGLACLDPRWAGGRPRLLSPDDEDFVAATATARPAKLGQPFTRWSSRNDPVRGIVRGRKKNKLRTSATVMRHAFGKACPSDTRALLSSRVGVRNEGRAGRCGFR